MVFWSYMMLIDLLIPAAMFLVGLRFRKKPPRAVNGIFGYRSSRSMKNPDTWQFANRYVGNIWFRWGMILLPLSVFPMLFVLDADTARINLVVTVVCLLQLIPILASIYLTEKALKENFDDAGNRKEKRVTA